MLKTLMIGTALSAMALSGALAQSNPTGSSQTPELQSSGTSATPSMNNSPSANQPASGPTAVSPSMSGGKFVSSQSSSHFLASKFTGTDVVGTDDKKIGDVNDVLFDQQGKIEAYVVGVGGFLGIGAKNVALNPSAFQVVKGDSTNADRLKLSMSKEELQNAPAFEPYKDTRTTTGSAGSGSVGGTRPSGAPASTNR